MSLRRRLRPFHAKIVCLFDFENSGKILNFSGFSAQISIARIVTRN